MNAGTQWTRDESKGKNREALQWPVTANSHHQHCGNCLELFNWFGTTADCMLKYLKITTEERVDDEAALPVDRGVSPRASDFAYCTVHAQTQTELPDSLHRSRLSLATVAAMANQSQSLCS